MQKNHRIRLLWSLLSLTMIAISSCKKEDVQLEKIASSMPTNLSGNDLALLNSSKVWYEQNSLKSGLRDEKIQLGTPDWSAAVVFKTSPELPQAIEMPLTNYNVNYAYIPKMAPGGFRYLLLRRAYNGKDFRGDIIELHPDTAYVNKTLSANRNPKDIKEIIKNGDFTGYLLVYTLRNTLRYGERREQGRAVSILSK